MFSGIVEEIGKISTITDTADGRRLRINANVVVGDAKLGDSISCGGACLTIVAFGPFFFDVEATHETLRRTKLGTLRAGDQINLERALRVSDRLGGHIVSGHVDAVGKVHAIRAEGFSRIIEFSVTSDLFPFFVEKGSVTIDGVSLTVAYLNTTSSKEFVFAVALIPHTLEVTTLSELKVGDPINVEADLIGKYVAKLVSNGYAQHVNKPGLSLGTLQEHGYT